MALSADDGFAARIKYYFEGLDPSAVIYTGTRTVDRKAITAQNVWDWSTSKAHIKVGDFNVDGLGVPDGIRDRLAYFLERGVSRKHVVAIAKRWMGMLAMTRGRWKIRESPESLLKHIIFVEMCVDEPFVEETETKAEAETRTE